MSPYVCLWRDGCLHLFVGWAQQATWGGGVTHPLLQPTPALRFQLAQSGLDLSEAAGLLLQRRAEPFQLRLRGKLRGANRFMSTIASPPTCKPLKHRNKWQKNVIFKNSENSENARNHKKNGQKKTQKLRKSQKSSQTMRKTKKCTEIYVRKRKKMCISPAQNMRCKNATNEGAKSGMCSFRLSGYSGQTQNNNFSYSFKITQKKHNVWRFWIPNKI